MMSTDEKKRFLAMALTCLRQPGDERPIFSPDTPTPGELEIIRKAINDGDIDEKLLERLFPMASKGVSKEGFMRYYFVTHNRAIRGLSRYADTGLIDWCTAYPAEVMGSGKKEGEWRVRLPGGKELATDTECYPGIVAGRVKKGDKVAVHRAKIHLVLSEAEYAEALRLFEEGKQQA